MNSLIYYQATPASRHSKKRLSTGPKTEIRKLLQYLDQTGQDTDFQRLNQNHACERAIMRKEEFFGKFNHAL
jgi:hypothetical protein